MQTWHKNTQGNNLLHCIGQHLHFYGLESLTSLSVFYNFQICNIAQIIKGWEKKSKPRRVHWTGNPVVSPHPRLVLSSPSHCSLWNFFPDTQPSLISTVPDHFCPLAGLDPDSFSRSWLEMPFGQTPVPSAPCLGTTKWARPGLRAVLPQMSAEIQRPPGSELPWLLVELLMLPKILYLGQEDKDVCID